MGRRVASSSAWGELKSSLSQSSSALNPEYISTEKSVQRRNQLARWGAYKSSRCYLTVLTVCNGRESFPLQLQLQKVATETCQDVCRLYGGVGLEPEAGIPCSFELAVFGLGTERVNVLYGGIEYKWICVTKVVKLSSWFTFWIRLFWFCSWWGFLYF